MVLRLIVQLNSIHFYGKKRENSSFLVPRNLKVVLGRGPVGKKWVFKENPDGTARVSKNETPISVFCSLHEKFEGIVHQFMVR